MNKSQIVLAILLLLSIVSCFLPWLKAKVIIDGEDLSTANSGYHYMIPLGARYTAPMAILSVIGFIFSAYSFKATQKIRMLNVIAGILILIGAIAAFAYTFSAALAEATGSFSYSIDVSGEYGMGLEALFGFLMIIVGARAKPEAGYARPRKEATETVKCYDCGLREATRKYRARDGAQVLLCDQCYEKWADTK